MEKPGGKEGLSIQAFRRLPFYLEYLRALREGGAVAVSAPAVAAHFGFTEVQVRKDFAAVSTLRGKPKLGFDLSELIMAIENSLGYNNADEAVLVGAGSLGHALLSFGGFEEYGLRIAAAFDADPELVGGVVNGVHILPVEKLSGLCRRLGVRIGIIAVPAKEAQIACDQLIAGGVLAIWNFAQTHLSVPDGVIVQNENMAASLALLSRQLGAKLNN